MMRINSTEAQTSLIFNPTLNGPAGPVKYPIEIVERFA